MTLGISTTHLPSANELKTLFAQTTWAAKRQESSINQMLQSVQVFVTIRHGDKLIGFGRAITDGVFRALIDDVIVHNEYQKKGLGKLIMTNLMTQLKHTDQIFLNTKPDLESFYSHFGFLKATSLTMKKEA